VEARPSPGVPPNADVSEPHCLSPAEQERIVRSLTLDEARAADLDWPGWAHEGQFEPEGRWSTWVIKGGRGFGKTKAGAEWVAALVRWDSHLGQSLVTVPIRIALVGATLDEVRRVMVGPSGLLEVAHDRIADWSPSLRRLRFKGGAEATLFSGASPERCAVRSTISPGATSLPNGAMRRRPGTCSSSGCAAASGLGFW
jgi:phage terminase large subunit-like protein